jgi:hypothetical protein
MVNTESTAKDAATNDMDVDAKAEDAPAVETNTADLVVAGRWNRFVLS